MTNKKLYKEATKILAEGGNPYIYMKQQLHYKPGDKYTNCQWCKHSRAATFCGDDKTACEIIGISGEADAIIDPTYYCDSHKN